MTKKPRKKSTKQFQQALQLHQRGNIAAAREIYLQLQATDPGNPEVLHYLGLTEYQSGNLEKAIELIGGAIQLSQKEPNYYSNLAMCYADKGQNEEAEKNYRAALKFDSRLIPALIGLGSLLGKQGKFKESEQYLSSVAKKQPNHVTANVNYALTLQKLGKHQQALIYAKKAVKIDPNNAVSQNNLGTIYQDLGEFSEAQKCFRKALSLNPGFGKAFYNLSHTKKFSEDDEDMQLVTQSEQFANSANVDTNNRISFHFGLGKIFDDLKLWDRAFRQFKLGNSLVNVAYDPNYIKANHDNIARHFNQQWMVEHNELGNRDVSPIFIVGMPRSGTTLLEQILTSHADVYSIGESQAIPDLTNVMSSIVKSEEPYPYCADKLDNNSVTELVNRYLEIARESEFYKPEKRSVDKMTTNYMHLGFIVTLFPNAKIIHCTRDALDVCLSCYFQDFTDRPGFAYRQENIGHFYNEYERIIRHWQETLSDHIVDISYEDIINDTESTIRTMLGFCDLPWDDNCLAFYESSRQIATASKWQVKQPIYKRSLNRWKNYESHLTPLQNILNQPSPGHCSADSETDRSESASSHEAGSQSVFKRLFSRLSS